ncbi:flagellin [Paracoccus sp. MBLB3053]|uniref:Flagellin n=1 Tax=Paracoccus aurantius TaxID=3073814 RepID=A0ABU2HMS7_9RHOB|nr:flagellin [Paracoccus sp. MBLB3053]MDS9466067.1 flagellin [Paracoccus sp. MBLB3053]
MSSILTNNSALVALQTLKGINSNLAKAQSEISTGKSVANAQDNAAIWAISKVMETDQSAFKAIQSNLNVAGATVATARVGAEQIADLLNEMKDLAVSANSDTADFTKIQTDIAAKKEQITSIIQGTQMNGVNLLKTNPVAGQTSFSVLGSLDRTNGTVATTANAITVDSVDFEADIEGATVTAITDRTTAATALGEIEALIDIAVVGAAELGSSGKRISDQSNFVGKLADSLKSGIGSLVDADMEETSARLQALQTQQQLGVQALSIANQAPSAILSLFR